MSKATRPEEIVVVMKGVFDPGFRLPLPLSRLQNQDPDLRRPILARGYLKLEGRWPFPLQRFQAARPTTITSCYAPASVEFDLAWCLQDVRHEITGVCSEPSPSSGCRRLRRLRAVSDFRPDQSSVHSLTSCVPQGRYARPSQLRGGYSLRGYLFPAHPLCLRRGGAVPGPQDTQLYRPEGGTQRLRSSCVVRSHAGCNPRTNGG